MKKYETPKFNISAFTSEDVLTTSSLSMSRGDWRDEPVEQRFGEIQ